MEQRGEINHMGRKHYPKYSGWRHAYRRVNGRLRPVLVKKVAGKEQIKIVPDEYIRQHHPRGAWDS